MALKKASVVPEDAIAIDEVEATKYIWDIISDWDKPSDTWALQYGPVVLGGINALCGIMINRHYRFKLRLGTFGYFASVVPITVMPGILTALFHRHLVSTDLLLMKREGCPMCYELRSAAIQLSLGLAYPIVLAPASALMLANRYSTYRIPDLQEGPRVIFKFLRKITRPFNGTLAFMATGQLVASSLLTYFEMRNHFTLKRKLIEIEAEIEAKQISGKS